MELQPVKFNFVKDSRFPLDEEQIKTFQMLDGKMKLLMPLFKSSGDEELLDQYLEAGAELEYQFFILTLKYNINNQNKMFVDFDAKELVIGV